MRLAGAEFEMDSEEGLVFLRHPNWSLVGQGSSLSEAIKDLLFEARELRDTLIRLPASRLDEQARSMLAFVLKA